jgi:hypothetical protein
MNFFNETFEKIGNGLFQNLENETNIKLASDKFNQIKSVKN